jgi:cytochrome o ubiquinol oxidase subunit 3
MRRINEPELLHAGLNLRNHAPAKLAQVESDVFGFWVFLMSDAVVFALLFGTFGAMLSASAGGPSPDSQFKLGPAFYETLALLTSSFSYGLVSLSLKMDARRGVVALWLVVTFCLGAWFLRLEIGDFLDMFRHGATPQRNGALSAFFVLVGTHGFHVACGLAWIVLMALQMLVYGLDERVKINFIRLGLFWHFLDVVWIGIFSVVYLRGLLG